MGSGEKVAEKVLLDKTEKTVFRPLIMMTFLYSARQRTTGTCGYSFRLLIPGSRVQIQPPLTTD
jgi:hypothetical protein